MKFGTADPNSTAAFRATTAATPPITLRRKRCACGVVVTAKQLTQFGGCVACVRAAANTKAAA
jgi:hypothetical protein